MKAVQQRPPDATLSWAARAVSPGARVVGWRRFTGGIISSVHRLSVRTEGGRVDQLVLKRWPVGDEGPDEALAQLDREAAALVTLEDASVGAPRLLARSNGAETDGWPALLMSRVPGRVWLDPNDQEAWLIQLATTLVHIHHLPVLLPPVEAWSPEQNHWVPSDATRPEVWREASQLLGEPAPRRSGLIHGDYQHFNVLWSRGQLSGVIDWAWAGSGPPERDLGHCRLNLAALYSPECADRFKTIYESVAGRAVDPWWDVYELLCYNEGWPKFLPVQVDGRVPVPAGMTARVEAVLANILSSYR